MSDFFSHLIARSCAEPPAIRPRLPSLFESAATETLSDAQPGAPLMNAKQPPQPISSTIPNSVSPEIISAAMPVADVPVTARTANLPSEINDPATALQSQRTPVPGASAKPAIEPEPNKAIVPTTSVLEKGDQVLAAKTKLFHEFSERPAFKPAQQISFSQLEPRPAAPAIHVTIGRVEVRAIQSTAPTPKPAKAVAPRLSLDDYLQKRDGGAR